MAAEKAGASVKTLQAEQPRIFELHFDSRRKRMTTIHQINQKDRVAYTKGAPKELMDLCDTVFINGEVLPLTDEH